MKFRKPQGGARWFVNVDLIGEGARELQRFVESLPDEFEIVPEGHVCVKWPEGLTRVALLELSGGFGYQDWTGKRAFIALAAIAPEKTKQMRRRVSVLQFQGHGENFGKLELSFNMDPQFPWVKVGECEIEN